MCRLSLRWNTNLGSIILNLKKLLISLPVSRLAEEDRQEFFNNLTYLTNVKEHIGQTFILLTDGMYVGDAVDNIDYSKVDVENMSAIELKEILKIREDCFDFVGFNFNECLDSILRLEIFLDNLLDDLIILLEELNDSSILKLVEKIQIYLENLENEINSNKINFYDYLFLWTTKILTLICLRIVRA